MTQGTHKRDSTHAEATPALVSRNDPCLERVSILVTPSMGKTKSGYKASGFHHSKEKRTYEAKKEDWLVTGDYRPTVLCISMS